MRCVQYREAVSAELDGESPGRSPAALAALTEHAGGCPGCASWRQAAARVTRLVRVAPAAPVPDLTGRILDAVATDAAARSRSGSRAALALRVALALVGLVQAGIGWPAVALGIDTMPAPMHVAHETGAWNVALAVAFLAVARRPRYAAGLLPLLAALVAALALVTLPDLVAGHVPPGRLGVHLLIVAGLVLVVAITRGADGTVGSPAGGRGSWPATEGEDGGDPAGVDRAAPHGLPTIVGVAVRPARGNAA